jgi:hypothetical protein
MDVRQLFIAIAFLPGCFFNHHDGAGAENIPLSAPLFAVQPNTATGVIAGTQAGYGIRTLNGTSTFRVLWTGDGSVGGCYHEFWGSLWTTGTLTGVTYGCTNAACPLESGDYVATNGPSRIDWDTFANDGLDGFEVTTDTLPLYIDAFIDGERIPSLVFFPDATQGGTIATVTAIPFAVTAQ